MATCRVTRICSSAVMLTLGLLGCTPLIATIGYEDGEQDADVAAEDAAAPPADAAQERDATLPTDGALDAELAAADAAARPAICWRLPDVVNPRLEAGVQSVDEGVVFGATDEALGCLDGGTLTTLDPLIVTYSRRDNRPLLSAGQPYSVSGPTNAWGSLNFHMGEWCQQSPLPAGFSVITPGGFACLNLDPLVDTKSIRTGVAPLMWPAGGRLCDVHCGDPGLPSWQP